MNTCYSVEVEFRTKQSSYLTIISNSLKLLLLRCSIRRSLIFVEIFQVSRIFYLSSEVILYNLLRNTDYVC